VWVGVGGCVRVCVHACVRFTSLIAPPNPPPLHTQAMCQEHEVNCCVVGVPKSIDNDILLIDK